MNANRRVHFKGLLLTERARIRAVLDRVAEAAHATGGSVDHPPGVEPDVGGVGVGPYDDDALATRESAALAEVEGALELLHATPDRYGVCAKCQRPIPETRLEILPATRFCHKHAA